MWCEMVYFMIQTGVTRKERQETKHILKKTPKQSFKGL